MCLRIFAKVQKKVKKSDRFLHRNALQASCPDGVKEFS